MVELGHKLSKLFGDQIHRRELKTTRHEGGIMGGSKRGTTGGGGVQNFA